MLANLDWNRVPKEIASGLKPTSTTWSTPTGLLLKINNLYMNRIHIFNYIILEIFLEYGEVEEYADMTETLKKYLDDYVNGRRNEIVDAYVRYAIHVFDKHLGAKTIYKDDMGELYELLELAKLI